MTDAAPALRALGARRIAVAFGRACLILTTCFAVLALILRIARAYQQPVVRSVLSAYLAAPREAIPLSRLSSDDQGIRAAPRTDPETADFIVVDVDAAACGEHTAVAFRYGEPRRAYGRVFPVTRQPAGSGLTHILMPIYDGFRRLDVGDAPPRCIDGVYRVRDARQFSMLLEANLPPDWRRQPLYQRLAD